MSCYQHFPINGQDIKASSSNVGDLSNAALNLLRGKLGGNNDDWQVGEQDLWGPSYTAVNDLYTHVYFRQLIVCLRPLSLSHIAKREFFQIRAVFLRSTRSGTSLFAIVIAKPSPTAGTASGSPETPFAFQTPSTKMQHSVPQNVNFPISNASLGPPSPTLPISPAETLQPMFGRFRLLRRIRLKNGVWCLFMRRVLLWWGVRIWWRKLRVIRRWISRSRIRLRGCPSSLTLKITSPRQVDGMLAQTHCKHLNFLIHLKADEMNTRGNNLITIAAQGRKKLSPIFFIPLIILLPSFSPWSKRWWTNIRLRLQCRCWR